MQKGRYNTKQRYELLSYLQSVAGQHITVSDICKYFSDKGSKVGTTTIYRHLEKMVDEGIVKKYILDSTTAAYDQNRFIWFVWRMPVSSVQKP